MTAATGSGQNRLVGLRSRKHIAPFELVRPATVQEAHAAMQTGPRTAFMAGGLDLIDRMKGGDAVDRVVFLEGVATLRGIRRAGGKIVIGALATHAEVAHSEVLAAAVPDFVALWRGIANPRVRLAGTIGGNLMSGLPHYDAAPALLALDARATLSDDAGGSRTVAIDAVADHHGALLESVAFDEAPVLHLLADRSLHPTLSIYLAARASARGELHAARIAVGCAYARPVAIDLPVAGKSLHACAGDAAELAQAVAGALPAPIEDGVASRQYRRRMIEVFVRRLLVRLGARA